ncbi:MAG: type IV pilus secretin PilQ [Nevskiales bacterium]|nr:type IV pilus secretin PilQ [Nevskiales bacterium]
MFKPAAAKRFRLVGVLLLGFFGSAWGTQASARSLDAVDFVALGGDRVRVTLTLSDPPPTPSVFSVDRPARLSIDLPGTDLAVTERYRKIDVGNVRAVATAEAKGRTRVVVELVQPEPYKLDVSGNTVIIDLGVDGGAPAAAPVAQQPAARPAMAGGSSVTGVDFRRGEKGEGRVQIRLSNPKTNADVTTESGKIVARFRDTALAASLSKRLDVLDFATPVKFVDIRSAGSDSIIVITPVSGQDFEQAAYQTGDLFTVELLPLSESQLEEKRKQGPQFTGERISLSFQNVEVRSLLQIIADVAGTNMVISDAVKGEMAMRLENVPWDQALDIILRTKGLGMRQQGNVMLVAPVEEIAQREKVELEAQKQKTELSPLRSEIIQVNYAKATDIRSLLSSGETSLLSDRGRVTVDERTNTLLVLETREKLQEIRELVTRLDIPVRQVLIESRIVIANDDFARELGTRFGVSTISNRGSTTIGQSGSTLGSRDVVAGNLPTLDDSYIVNLPTASNPAGRVAWTILGSDFLVDLELSALQTEGRGEVISTPRVVTANGKQALIEQGREIPYQSSSGNTGTQTQFKKAVLSLTVTPQITPDDRVVMDLSVTNDSQGQNVNTGVGSAPAIDTRRLDTQVLIRSGETVVLGGVFQEENQQSASKVPLLGDIPLLGALFRNHSRSTNKRELLIFVTPKVLQEDLSTK